ncbi:MULTISPECIES: hypothetical protein [Bacillus cereus group]|nr:MULTISPECIES: hypothetical protein [Bacillus cereus group]
MNYLDHIPQLALQVPATILKDALYIEQQLRFVERVAARSKEHDI